MKGNKDEELWRIAQRRARLRRSIYTYFAINLICWFVWWITNNGNKSFSGNPWPVWVMLGSAISLIFQYLKAYQSNKAEMAERELQKLQNKQ